MARILVTGANGFIGRHAVAMLTNRGHEVLAVSARPQSGSGRGARWITADLLQSGEAERLTRDARADILLHLAWYTAPGSYWDADENLRWLSASTELVSAFAASGGSRVVGAGSCAEYEWTDETCVENATPLRPTSLYGRCKKELHDRLEALGSAVGMSVAWGRVFFLYGPHEHPSRVVASVIRSLLRGEEARCSQGTQVRDFMHVTDAAAAFVALLESPVRGPVNIASGHAVVLRSLIELIAAKLGRPDLLRFGALPARPDDPARIVADIRKLSNEVGWAPRLDLSTGLDDAIAWWRSHARAA